MINKKSIFVLATLASVSSLAFAQDSHSNKSNYHKHDTAQTETVVKPEETEIKIDMVKISETFGNFIGRNLNTTGIKFDVEALIKGIRSGSEGKPAPLNDQDYEKMMSKVQQNILKETSEKNLKEANEYIEKHAKQVGIKEIVPGKLHIEILQQGNGPEVVENGSPQINYTGKYINGTVFGTSKDSGPITLPLSQAIPGFSKGIVGMKEGEKRILVVHPDLAYGTSGQLPPNSLLIFEIEIVKADNKDANKSDADSSLDLDNDE